MSNIHRKIDYGAKETEEGFVVLNYRIENLKKGDKKGTAKNAVISDVTFNNCGFSIMVRGDKDGKMKDKVYQLLIKQLPYEINDKFCKYEVDDDFIIVHLKKRNEKQSWLEYIDKGTLERAGADQS